jgi:hypothetical protein
LDCSDNLVIRNFVSVFFPPSRMTPSHAACSVSTLSSHHWHFNNNCSSSEALKPEDSFIQGSFVRPTQRLLKESLAEVRFVQAADCLAAHNSPAFGKVRDLQAAGARGLAPVSCCVLIGQVWCRFEFKFQKARSAWEFHGLLY